MDDPVDDPVDDRVDDPGDDPGDDPVMFSFPPELTPREQTAAAALAVILCLAGVAAGHFLLGLS